MRIRLLFTRWTQKCRRTPQGAAENDSSQPSPPPGAKPSAPTLATLPPPTPASPIRPSVPDAPSDAGTRSDEVYHQVCLVHAPLVPSRAPSPLPPAATEARPPATPPHEQGGEPMQTERAKNARRRSPAADAASPAGAQACAQDRAPPSPSFHPSLTSFLRPLFYLLLRLHLPLFHPHQGSCGC